MADKTVKTRLQIKHDTSTNWGKATFKVLDGELIYYTDTKQLKIGDGNTTPKDLPVYADGVTQEDLNGLLFAGSDSHGGAANSAKKLTNTTKIGSATEPVYFSASGVPVKCGTLPYAAASTPGRAANSAEKLVDAQDVPLEVGTTTNPVYFHDGVPVETNIQWAKGATSGDRPALYTNKIIKGNVASGVDHHVGGSKKPIYIDSNGVPQEISGLSLDSEGNAATATKLKYSTTFDLTGAVEATGVSFNGGPKLDAGGNISGNGNNTVDLNVTSVKESYLAWGGKNFAGNFGPIDAAMVPELGANRFQFLKPAGVTVEYSRDAGATWIDYGASEDVKKSIFSTNGTNVRIGKADSTNSACAAGNLNKYQVRIIIDTSLAKIYTVLNKFVIYCSTNGSNNCWCSIDIAKRSAPSSWSNIANKVKISGWSGYNVINTTSFTTYGNSDSQNQFIRFTFGEDGTTTYASDCGLAITNIKGFGGVGWTTPSTMAKTGHVYSFDCDANVTFPGTITTTKGFKGTADVATKLGTANVGDDDEPIYLKAGVPTKGKRIPNILTGTTAPTSDIGQNGDIYLMPYANNMPAIYSGTSAPASTLGVDGDIYILYE